MLGGASAALLGALISGGALWQAGRAETAARLAARDEALLVERREAQVQAVRQEFRHRIAALRVLASQPGTVEALKQFKLASGPGSAEAALHRAFGQVQDQYALQDVLLIDSDTDQVVYSLARNLDLGIVAGTPLAAAYASVHRAQGPESLGLSEASAYAPAGGRTVVFAAVPVYEGELQLGVLAWRCGIERLFPPAFVRGSTEGLPTLRTLVLGPDGKALLQSGDSERSPIAAQAAGPRAAGSASSPLAVARRTGGRVDLLAGGALMFLLMRRWLAPLATLQSTLRKLQAGDLKARSRLVRDDELGDTGRLLDRVLDERLAVLDRATQENDALNTSVIGLLQTVFQLSNKDLTARADVTEDIIGTLSSSINQLGEETGRTLVEVQQIAEQVRSACEFVGEQALRVDETAQEERASLEAMASGLNQATYQLAQMAALSNNSSEAAEQAWLRPRPTRRSPRWARRCGAWTPCANRSARPRSASSAWANAARRSRRSST